MSCNIYSFKLTIDGEKRNKVLKRFKDIDDFNYYDELKNGYYPLVKDRNWIRDIDIVAKVAKLYPKSEITWTVKTEYGTSGIKYHNGKFHELKRVVTWIVGEELKVINSNTK